MKIYTRTGDKGTTSLIGGTRVSKAHLRIEAYGSVDELNSYLGLLRSYQELKDHNDLLVKIQETLFSIGSILAVEEGKSFDFIPGIQDSSIDDIEKAIDDMDKVLPQLKNFVLPGGHPIVGYCHVARCVCRRAERNVIFLGNNESVDDIVIRYLNRLSDYLFVLSRKLSLDLNVEEIPWQPAK